MLSDMAAGCIQQDTANTRCTDAIISGFLGMDGKETKYWKLEASRVGKTGRSILQRIENKTEKAFEQWGPIKTQPCSKD